MISDETKRTIGFSVFGFGIFGGLWGCVAYARAAFVMGANDNLQEILALTFALATPLPACILALWQRVIAGSWLMFAGAFLPYGLVAERAYMIQVMGFPDQPTIVRTILTVLPVSCVLVGIGLFGVLTGLLKWPKLLGNSQSSTDI